jgi:hypothetical protein
VSPHDSAGKSDNLFESIAQLLDPSQRAFFYERMVYFRHLRPDDELLRLVEAIGFLAVIIRAAPEAVAVERAQIEEVLATSLTSLQAVTETAAAYHRKLDARLSGLPAAIADGISPRAIAHAIAEHLRQQLVQTGLPVTAGALALTTRELSAVLAVAQRTVQSLVPWTDAAMGARQSVEQVRATVVQTTDEAQHALTMLRRQFTADYKQALTLVCGAALLLGTLVGVEVQRWRDARADAAPPVVVSGPSVAPEPAATLKNSPTRHRAAPSSTTAATESLDGPLMDHRRNSDGTTSHAVAPTP